MWIIVTQKVIINIFQAKFFLKKLLIETNEEKTNKYLQTVYAQYHFLIHLLKNSIKIFQDCFTKVPLQNILARICHCQNV